MHVGPVVELENVLDSLLQPGRWRRITIVLSTHVVPIQGVAARPLKHILDWLQANPIRFSSNDTRAVAFVRSVESALARDSEELRVIIGVVIELAGLF